MRRSLGCISMLVTVLFAAPAAQAADDVSVQPFNTTLKALIGSKATISASCSAPCDLKIEVSVTPAVAKRLGLLSFKSAPVIASGGMTGAPAGASKLPVSVDGTVSQFFLPDAALPLFKKSMPVRVTAHATIAGVVHDSTASGAVTWPKLESFPGGRGRGGLVTSLRVPAKVPVRARTLTATLTMRRWPGPRFFLVGLMTAGGHGNTISRTIYKGSREVDGEVADGGTFRVVWKLKALRKASPVAPLAAQVYVSIVNLKGRGGEDHSIARFTLTK
ncbi:MAG: hypothetical protein QOJ29_3570 [Thermoleophilaceae bacterium]|nr:hypothetical protein [Thermoleophilaceae bacterium]